MKYTRVRAAALILVLTLMLVFTGCSASRPIKGSDQELAVVGQAGGFDVLYEELRYVTLNYKKQFELQYGEGVWEDEELAEEHRAELERLVLKNITANYAVLSLCAEVSISIDEKTISDAVDDYIADFVDELGGRGEYKAALKEYYMTDHFMRFTIGVDYCQNELFYVYSDDLGLIETDEETIYNYIMDGNFVRTLHVFISNDVGDDIGENRKKAEEVLEQLHAGTDIKTLIGSSINEDFSLTTTNGYYFTHGEMIKPYEEAAFSLNIGDVSDIVETDTGFFVIERLALDEKYVIANLATLIEQYQYAIFNDYIDQRQSELSITLNEFGKSLDLTKIN